MRTRILKGKAPDRSGAFALEGTSAPRKNVNSILFAPFWSSNVLVVGINDALARWIRRVALVGTAARARPCGHAFFMFRFLA